MSATLSHDKAIPKKCFDRAKQLWESNSARAASTALLAAPIALTKSILSIKNRQIKFYLDRTVRAEAKKSQPPIELGTRQAKNKQGFKGWRDLEAR